MHARDGVKGRKLIIYAYSIKINEASELQSGDQRKLYSVIRKNDQLESYRFL